MTHAAFKDSELLTGRALGTTFTRENATEPYVEIPPAFLITDSSGATWTLGTEYIHNPGSDWGMEFNVLRNDVDTGEFASRIVYQRHKVRIFGKAGWRCWSGKSFI